VPQIEGWEGREELSNGTRRVFFGEYRTPIFQAGEPPYLEEGGFVVDASGTPQRQRWESVPFTIVVPSAVAPAHRVLVWSDGTGASRTGFLSSGLVGKALAAGFVVAKFEPQFHAERAVNGSDAVLHSFNFLNPVSGRTVFRQQAVDTAYFVRVLREALPRQAELPVLDTSSLVYGGHSQGAIVGAIVAGVETEFVAYFLNGVGAYLSSTVVERKDPVDVPQLVASLAGVSVATLEVDHPVVQLMQLCAEPVDPENYAASWRGVAGAPRGAHVFLSNGARDATTPVRSIDAMMLSGWVSPLAGEGWDPDPFSVAELPALPGPIAGNT